jgi:hypothetical protein
MSVCPRCWGTTVSPEALAAAKLKLSCVREAYATRRAVNKKLRGRERGMGGRDLARIGEIGRALRAEIDRIEALTRTNKASAMLVGAAAGSAHHEP